MTSRIRTQIAAALIASVAALAASPAFAAPVSMVGTITTITLAPDGKSAVAVLKNVKTGEDVTVHISDDETLDKFKDKRIVEGDEIRSKYENDGGKNQSKSFRKSAGC